MTLPLQRAGSCTVRPSIGILTAGGDSPGLSAAIRGMAPAAIAGTGTNVVGFEDGLRGPMQRRFIRLDSESLSGILTAGGTVLGKSRENLTRWRRAARS